jgi:hypothetical protein
VGWAPPTTTCIWSLTLNEFYLSSCINAPWRMGGVFSVCGQKIVPDKAFARCRRQDLSSSSTHRLKTPTTTVRAASRWRSFRRPDELLGCYSSCDRSSAARHLPWSLVVMNEPVVRWVVVMNGWSSGGGDDGVRFHGCLLVVLP